MFQLTNPQKRFLPPPAEDPGELSSFPPLGSAIKVLMIWPKIPPSFWSFQGMMNLVPEKTTMPPLGEPTSPDPPGTLGNGPWRLCYAENSSG